MFLHGAQKWPCLSNNTDPTASFYVYDWTPASPNKHIRNKHIADVLTYQVHEAIRTEVRELRALLADIGGVDSRSLTS